jgi:CHASE2 domain-containing sensor protein
MTSRSRRRRHFIHAAWTIIGVSLATLLLEHLGFLDRFETAGLDAFTHLSKPRDPRDVFIVGISDEDYNAAALFHGTSPLDCAVLTRVLGAIAAGKPLLIGVDLDTSSPGFTPGADPGCLRIPDDWPPIGWAEDAVRDPVAREFTAARALGGHGPVRTTHDRSGLDQLPRDADGVIRRYYRELPLKGGQSGDSFPWAVIRAACERGVQDACRAMSPAGESADALRLNFAAERFRFDPFFVGYVLQLAEGKGAKEWAAHGLLTDRIVLLGGYYAAAHDVQPTPVGPMSGVQILAQAVASELHGGGIRPVNEVLAFVLELAAGFLLVAISERLRNRLGLALLAGAVLIPLICIFGSYFAFSTSARWFNFVPVIASVMIHEAYEHVQEYRRLRVLHVRTRL